MNMESATIVRWLKQEGDSVVAGESLAEVETDKTTTELEAESSGKLLKLLAAEGECVAVNRPLAIIGSADEDISGLLRPAAAQADSHAHVERVYESWRRTPAMAASTRTNGASSMARPQMTAERLERLERPQRPERLDPEAIRARLMLNGALAPTQPVTRPVTQKRIVIYGAGLGAKQLLEVTRHLQDVAVVGLIDDNETLAGAELGGLPVLGGFDALADLASRAMVGMEVEIGPGALIEAGAIVGPGTIIGEGAIVDVGAVVAHDCFLGAFSHLSPGCRLSGVVNLVENVMVGVGAAINSTVTIGRNVIVAPGAAVMNDVPDDAVVSGVPAKVIGQSRRGG